MATERKFIPLNIAVLTVSDSRTEATDKSGKLLAERAAAAGHRVCDKQICPDDIYAIRAIVSRWIADINVNAVVSTGGTGVTGRDGTPEAMGLHLPALRISRRGPSASGPAARPQSFLPGDASRGPEGVQDHRLPARQARGARGARRMARLLGAAGQAPRFR